MKIFLLCSFILSSWFVLNAQESYSANANQPFGKLNPEAPAQVSDYADLIGTCDCVSTKRNPDQSWAPSQKMTWTFKYIMNGTAVQDETIKEDGSHSGSIRTFIADSSKWYVHWYSNTTPSTALPTWSGGKEGKDMVLYRPQNAPNGMKGMTRLSFREISKAGFEWALEWIDENKTIVYPSWKISCTKRVVPTAREIILKNTANFSKAYMNLDSAAISEFYTEDAKIFPSNTGIISGREAIQKRWEFPLGVSEPFHKVTPTEIKIVGDYAYDYGLYEGSITNKEGKANAFKGKYVIVWKRTHEDWKIYLDIWNRI